MLSVITSYSIHYTKLYEHVTAPLVAGQGAVADQEGHGPDVVGDDPHRHIILVTGAIAFAGKLLDVADNLV